MIKLTKDQAWNFATNKRMKGFTFITEVEDKDTEDYEHVLTMTIQKENTTRKYYSLEWHKSIYGDDIQHEVDSTEIYEIKEQEVNKLINK